MLHLFAALFKMPLWLLLLIAAGLGSLGYHSQQKAILHETEKTALLASPEANAIPISTFNAKPPGKTVIEAHVNARWAPEYNTKFFTTEKSGAQTPNGSLVLLMSEAADKTGSKEVAAAIFVPPASMTNWSNGSSNTAMTALQCILGWTLQVWFRKRASMIASARF